MFWLQSDYRAIRHQPRHARPPWPARLLGRAGRGAERAGRLLERLGGRLQPAAARA